MNSGIGPVTKSFDEQAIYDVLSGTLLAGRLAPGA